MLVSEPDRWFIWDYWSDEATAPDFAKTVDIHRKPGYDPRELRLAPGLPGSRLRLATKLLRRAVGQRTLLDVISLDTTRVGGSHGRCDASGYGVLMMPNHQPDLDAVVPCTAVRDLVLQEAFGTDAVNAKAAEASTHPGRQSDRRY